MPLQYAAESNASPFRADIPKRAAPGGQTLVTGGAGFVGSHLVQRLAAAGHRVRVMELAGAAADHLAPHCVEVVRGDIRSTADVRRAMHDCEAVFHVAGNPNLWAARRNDLHSVNFVGARTVLQCAVAQRIAYAVHTSTESILSDTDPKQPLRDDSEVALRDVVGVYGRSKARAERFALALGRAGHRVYVACPTMPVGPGDRGLSPPTRLITDFCNGKLPAILDCKLNLVDVRDVAEAMMRLPACCVPGRRYLLGGHNILLSDLLRQLAQLTGTTAPRWRIPYPVALAVGLAGEWMAAVVTQRRPVATVAGVMLAGRNLHVAEGHTVGRFGIALRTLDQSLRDTIGWLVEHGVVGGLSHPGEPIRLARSKLQPAGSPAKDAPSRSANW